MVVHNQQAQFDGAGRKVIVVGGGISGQTAGYRLQRQGFEVKVYEADPSVIGGEMSSVVIDGYTINRASTLLPSSYDQIIDLARELGLGDRLRGSMPAVLSVPREGKMHRLRVSGGGTALDGLTTGLLSLPSKLRLIRLGLDVSKVKNQLNYDSLNLDVDRESLGDYAARRLNPEISEYLIEPLMRASYLYEPASLSILDFFFAIAKFTGVDFIRYEGGFDFVNQALARLLGTVSGARVLRVEEKPDGVTVTWEKDGQVHVDNADACIVAIPAWAVSRIVPGLTERQKDILDNHIRYGNIIKGSHALKSRSDDPTTMMSFPRSESVGLGTITFDHNYRDAITPLGGGLISSYWVNDWSADHISRGTSDAEIKAEMIGEIDRFIPGFRQDLLFTHLNRWPKGTVVSYAGMWRYSDEFRRSVAPSARVQYAGDYFNIPGTKAASLTGEVTARRVARALGNRMQC